MCSAWCVVASGCPAWRAQPTADARGVRRDDGPGLRLGNCGRCEHFPVHGVLLATDAGRDEPISDAERELLSYLHAKLGKK